MRRRFGWFVPTLLAGIASSAGGQATRDLDSAFTRVRGEAAAPAVAMAVVYGGRVAYANVAGFADLEHRVRATGATRFDWASIAKQFTAYAVSLLVQRGVLGADDDVRRWLPELDLGGARITLRQLLSHTSGLEDGDGLLVLAGWRPGEVVRHADLVRLLSRQQHLRFSPGSGHAYSNGGYSLLVEVVQRASGVSFAAFTDSAIFRPLGMTSTQFVDGATSLIPHRAMPYWPNASGVMAPSTNDLYPGAGGLFSTVGDMGLWMAHAMSPQRDVEATMRLREVGVLSSGEPLTYAWGLSRMMDRGQEVFLHGGSGPAVAAQLVMYPALGIGVVAASAGEVGLDPSLLARTAIDAFVGKRLGARPAPTGQRMTMITEAMTREVPAEARAIRATAGEMAALIGNYRLADSTVLSIRRSGPRLEFSYGAHAPWMPLHPIGGGRFVRVPWWEVLSPVLDAGPGSSGLRIARTDRSLYKRGDSVQIAPRIPARTFPAESAARYEGRYYSDELEALYEVRSVGEALELRHPRHGAMKLVPLDGDTFAVEGAGIVQARFTSGGGRMVGLELQARSWGVTAGFRRVAF